MAVVSGQRTTSNVLATQRVIDLHRPILLNEPDKAPFTVFTKSYNGGAMREAARDKKFTWHNDALWDRHDAINAGAGYAAGITSIVVDDGTLFTANDVVYVPRTREVMIVTAVSTNTLTVERGAGAVAAAALVDDDPLLIYGTAFEEGSLPRTAKSANPVLATNYTEIFKRTTEASGTWLSSSNESSPHDWPHQVKKDFLDHYKDIELAAFFGSPGIEVGPDGKDRTLTGGALYYMTLNNTAAGGAWTLPEISTFIRGLTRYGSDTKVFFVSTLVASVLSEHSMNKLTTDVGDTRFGVKIMEWMDPNGTLSIVKHPLFEGSTSLTGMGVALDFKSQAVAYRYLDGDGPGSGRDTFVETNVEETGRDGRRDQIIAECGFRFGLPETGGVVTGVTSAS